MSLPQVFLSRDPKRKTQAAVLGFFQADPVGDKGKTAPKEVAPLKPAAKSTKGMEGLLKYLVDSKHFFGKKNETSLVRCFPLGEFGSVLLSGLGSKAGLKKDTVRQAGAALYQAQKKERLSLVTLAWDNFLGSSKPTETLEYVQVFLEGYLLASYDYHEFKKNDPNAFSPEGLELIGVKGADKVLQKTVALVGAVNFARTLGDKPGNALTPTEFSRLAREMGKGRALEVRVMGKKDLEKEKMGLFLGVAQGSAEEPQLVVMQYRGGKKADRPIALVGKGVTFDSGGISLKPADRMEDMKYDMMGAATVAAVMQGIADLKLPVNVTGYVGLTENLPGGKAQKPGDVKTSSSGKTVEIINTDAEGRLVLADVLEYAQKEDPQAILDFATLTGAVVVALGTVTTGIMGTHPELLGAVKAAGAATDERVWELPLYEEYEDDLKSHYADIKNSGSREAGSSKAGTFLKFFIDKKFPWVHFDIAGSAYHRKDRNYHPPRFGAGVMVRLMVHLLANWKAPKAAK